MSNDAPIEKTIFSGGTDGNQPSTQRRNLKSIRRDLKIGEVSQIMFELFSLQIDRLELKPLLINLPGITEASTTRLTTVFSKEKIIEIYTTNTELSSNHLFPSDVLKIIAEATLFTKEESLRLIAGQERTELLPIIKAVEKKISDQIKTAQSFLTQWGKDEKISLEQELKFLREQKDEGFITLSEIVKLCFEYHKQLRGLFDEEYAKQIEEVDDPDLLPDYSELEEKDRDKLPTGSIVSFRDGKPERKTTQEPDSFSPEKIDAKQAQSTISQLSRSLSQQIVPSLISAYTLDEDGNSLISLDDLDENIRDALVRHLSLQVENIVSSLSAEEFDILINNKTGASAIRLRLLRKSHQFALQYPPLRVLIQTAIDSTYAKLNDTREVQEQLAEQVQNTTHEKAAENLEKIAQKEWEIGSQLTNLTDISNTLNLIALQSTNPGAVQQQFAQRLSELLGPNVDQATTLIAMMNLEKTIASMIISNPLLSTHFVNYLDRNKIKAFLGDIIPNDVYDQRKEQILELIKQYWIVYRADLNRKSESLNRVAEQEAQQVVFDEEQVKNVIHRSSLVRQKLMGTDKELSTNEVVDVLLGTADTNSFNTSKKDETKEIKKIVKIAFWENSSVNQRVRYLREVGVLVGDQQPQTLEELDLIYQDQQLEIDYFVFFEIENSIQQEQLMAEALYREVVGSTILQSIQAEEQFVQLRAILQADRFFVSGEMITPEMFYLDDYEGDDLSFPGFEYLPGLFQDEGALANELGGAVQGQQEEMLKQVASLGVDAALIVGTNGAWSQIPKPIRDMINNLIVEQGFRQIKEIFQMLKIAAAAIGAAALAALAGFMKIMSALGGVGGAALMGGAGALLGSPALALGGLIGGGLSGLLAGGVGGKLLGSSAAGNAALTGAGNIGSVLSGLGRTAASKAGLTGAGSLGKSLLGKQSAAASTTSSAVGTVSSTAATNWIVFGGYVGFTTTVAVISTFQTQSAMLVEYHRSPINIPGFAEEKRLIVQKTSEPSTGVMADTEISYSIVIKASINTGQEITNLSLIDKLDDQLIQQSSISIDSTSPGVNCDIQDFTISCTLPNLKNNETIEINYRATTVNDSVLIKADGKTPIVNKVEVEGDLEGETILAFSYHSVNGGGEYIAQKALENLEDPNGLKKGWWGYYNYHPLYTSLFDFPQWAAKSPTNPDPPCMVENALCPKTESRDPATMYWCTWNVIHAFQNAGTPIPHNTGVTDMRKYFRTQQDYIGVYLETDNGSNTSVSDSQLKGTKPKIQDAKIGDVAFMQKGSGTNYDLDAHVAIVIDISSTTITTCDSNNFKIRVTYAVNSITGEIQPIGSIHINGFGRLL